MRTILLISVFLFIVVVKDTDAWRRRRRRRSSPDPPPPDTTPPTIYNCPQSLPNQHTTTSTAVVTWTEPTCSDAGGSCTLSRSGSPSGSQFTEGYHSITYTARDAAGNTRTCSITFTVVVIRCITLSTPSHCTVTCSQSNSVGSVCMYTCYAGYTLTGGSSSRICQQLSGNSAAWSGTQPTCTDSQPPTFISCPDDINTHADKNSDSTAVTWTVTANDNDGHPPSVTCNPTSGATFTAGDHSVTCEATDQTGNKNQCDFNVAVEVLYCSDFELPVVLPSNQSCNTQYGSQCTVGCDLGYDLIGSNQTTCEFDGTDTIWSGDWHCEMIGCLSFTLPQGVNIYPESCVNDYKVPPGTVCNFYCQHQLTLVGDGESVTCDQNVSWDRAVNISSLACSDKMAPTITNCPNTITADRTEYWGVEVSFNTPTAADNFDQVLDFWTSPDDIRSPYNFTTDTTCEYHFQDDAENTASCIFNVILHDTVVPEVLYCPPSQSMRSSLEMTPVTWDEPVFRDIPGDDVLVTCNFGSNNIMLPWGDNHVVYTATNLKNGLSATCDFFIKIEPMPCLSLRAPAHGALACDGWVYGRYCSMSCNEDYDIPAQSPFQAPTDLYVCGSSGQWSPMSYVPDCSYVRDPTKNNLPSDLLYYSGQCGSPDTMNTIAQSFIQTINKSVFKDICYMEDGCSVDNVAVTCGWPTKRRKRALIARRKRAVDVGDNKWIDIQEWGEYSRANEIARDDLHPITISMVLAINITRSTQEALSKLIQLSTDIQTHMMSENRIGQHAANRQDQEDTIHSYLLVGDNVIACPDGFVADHDNLNCVACTTGHRYDSHTRECIKCQHGFYQAEYSQMSCTPCPNGQSTAEKGSRSLTDCRDQCDKGHFSTSGFVPCIKCPLATFQPLTGQTQCFECPDGMKTTIRGASDVNQCA